MPHPLRIQATVMQVLALSCGPVPVRSLVDLGLVRGQLRAACIAGELLVVRRGVVVPRMSWQDADESRRRWWALEAALLAYPGAWASHDSAARLHGLPDYRLERDPAVTMPLTHITRPCARPSGRPSVIGSSERPPLTSGYGRRRAECGARPSSRTRDIGGSPASERRWSSPIRPPSRYWSRSPG